MKLKSVDTSNNVLALLLFFRSDEYIASSTIRDRFNYINLNTLRSWLKDWVKAGILNKIELVPNTAGGVKAKFKLSSKGLNMREELVKRFMQTLKNRFKQLNIDNKAESNETLYLKNRSERINNFIIEFSEEFSELIDNNYLADIQEKLQKMLKNYL